LAQQARFRYAVLTCVKGGVAMQGLRRVGKVTLTGCLTMVFLASTLLPRQSIRPAYAVEPVPIPLPAVEDPLGQQPEQSTPEISVNVDVRDGHLTVRVVDLWGGVDPLSWTLHP
jgi:hypothetical protein